MNLSQNHGTWNSYIRYNTLADPDCQNSMYKICLQFSFGKNMANFCDKIRLLGEDTTDGKCVTIVPEDEMMAICSS